MAEDRVEESNQEVKNPTPGQSVQDKPLQSRRVAPSTRGAASRAQKKYWMLVAGAVLAVAYAGNEFTPMMVFYRGENVFGSVFVDALLACYAAGIAAGLLLCGPLSDLSLIHI